MSWSPRPGTFSGNLAQFAGAHAQDESIGKVGLSVCQLGTERMSVEADSHPYFACSVWCVCFHLYSGAEQFCFRVLETVKGHRDAADAANAQLAVCTDVDPFDALHDVKARISIGRIPVQLGEKDEHGVFASGSNTAIQFVPSRPMAAYPDSQLPRQVDVLLHVVPDTAVPIGDSGRVSWHLVYRRSFMCDLEARRLAATVEHVAGTLLRNPSTKIMDLGTSPMDWDAISKWNKINRDLERRDHLVHLAFAAAARAHSQGPALAACDGQMNYRELDESSSALAKHLVTSGGFSNGGSKWIALCFGKSHWAIVGMLAVLKAGCACVFLDPSYPDHRLRHILEATGTRVVLTSARDESLVGRLSNLDMGERGSIRIYKIPCVDASSVDIASAEPRLRRDSGVDVVSVASPADPAFAIFT